MHASPVDEKASYRDPYVASKCPPCRSGTIFYASFLVRRRWRAGGLVLRPRPGTQSMPKMWCWPPMRRTPPVFYILSLGLGLFCASAEVSAPKARVHPRSECCRFLALWRSGRPAVVYVTGLTETCLCLFRSFRPPLCFFLAFSLGDTRSHRIKAMSERARRSSSFTGAPLGGFRRELSQHGLRRCRRGRSSSCRLSS